jgi:hypothetical protein
MLLEKLPARIRLDRPPRKILQALANVLAKSRPALLASVHAENQKLLRQMLIQMQVVQGWQQFAPGKIAMRADDDQYRGVERVGRGHA